jgi:hypothetical protein
MAENEETWMEFVNDPEEDDETEEQPTDPVRPSSRVIDQIEGCQVDADEVIVLWTLSISK